jgi:predicted transcriptional regulator
MAKAEIRVETVEAFFDRGRKAAELADRGRPMPRSHVVAFEEVGDLLRVLTDKRVSLLRKVKQNPGSISELAKRLKRDRSAVTRDVQLLEQCGVLRVTEKSLPGHGRQKWITPIAPEIQLIANL